jgi:FtsP/CotA-like multicopper oxidase with cupredoxin domain
VETLTPPSNRDDAGARDGRDGGAGGASPPTPRTARASGPGESGGVWFGAVLAVVALVFAVVALVMGGGGDSSGDTSADGGAGSATVELSEFALTPASVSVAAGGSLEVVNAGTVPHNLSIDGTDIATSDLAGGDSETLDLSSLEPGDYTMICTIAGHEDAGMTGTITVTEGGATGGLSSAAGGEGGDAAAGHDHSVGMTEEQYAEMSEAMNATIGEFPAETEGSGNQVLEPQVKADGTKVFELTAEIVEWEIEPGEFVEAWAYNGMVPGPQLHADVGDMVEIVVNNELPMATDVHVHGINVPNSMDGVAPITQDLIQPGESFTYAFTTDEPAVAMYHPHHHGQLQMPNGMLGTLLVGDMRLPEGQTVGDEVIPADLEVSQEIPMVLNDSGAIGYSLNGKSFPATEPLVAETGDWVEIHYFNEGSQIHPMHMHQFDQVVVAKDGYPLDHPYVADTVNVAPGERYTVLAQLDEPGTWVWHCHILNHVEAEEGMFGMVTAVVVS